MKMSGPSSRQPARCKSSLPRPPGTASGPILTKVIPITVDSMLLEYSPGIRVLPAWHPQASQPETAAAAEQNLSLNLLPLDFLLVRRHQVLRSISVSEAAEHRVPPFVYVADRERSIADAVAATLNENGYEAIAFSSGEQLVEAATVLKPDLVIAAVSMEGMTGVEAALRICRNIPECRVVLFVARKSAGRSLRQIAQKNGFILLATPVQPDALLQCLNDMASNAAG